MSIKSPDAVDIAIGARIRAARVAKGMKQAAVAEQLGISFQQFQKYELATNRLSAGRLHQIAGILGTTVGVLVDDGARDAAAVNGETGIIIRMLGTPLGRDVVEAFLAIEVWEDRRALLRVARAMGRSP